MRPRYTVVRDPDGDGFAVKDTASPIKDSWHRGTFATRTLAREHARGLNENVAAYPDPRDRLRHHVTGAIARGEAVAVVEKPPRPYDVAGAIIAYEEGSLDEDGVLTLFAYLVRTGMAWTLQGCYGRQAMRFINDGLIDRHGAIL